MLLAVGLARHESIDLTSCVKCGIAVLADQLSLRRRTCASCHRPTAPAVGIAFEAPGPPTSGVPRGESTANIKSNDSVR
jgi:hypothetical protein